MKSATRLTLGSIGIASLITVSVLWANPAWAMQIFADTPNDGQVVLDVESSDTIENLKTKIADKILVPAQDQCLTFNGVFLVDELTVSDYGILKESTISMNELPVIATWSVTPDDPAMGRDVSNSIHSSLGATDYQVVDGALPVGMTLNGLTGAISGRFEAAGPFDVTIGVTTVCGVAYVDWSGTVPANLPSTGADSTAGLGAATLAGMLGLSGAVLVATRRQGHRRN